jgi:hypothetical protein
MHKVLLFCCLLLPNLTFGQVVKAQLIHFSADSLPPDCGYSMQVATLHFRLLETEGLHKKGEEILVKIMCAEQFGRKVYANKRTYQLTLHSTLTEPEWAQKELSLNAQSVESFAQEPQPFFWCSTLKRLKRFKSFFS